MRTIVQISDLHFGKTFFATVEPLLLRIAEISPDLVVISGDLTQRARVAQFQDARRFIERLPTPQLIVPGNHDVPLYDVARRFVAPYQRYTEFVTGDLAPAYIDDEVAVVGINTARAFVFKGGEIDTRQLDTVADQFARANAGQVRIVVAHHPFDVPEHIDNVEPVKGSVEALHRFSQLDVRLILAGHLHMIHEVSASRYVPGYDAQIVHAGTTTSTRARGEPNSFFVVRVDGQHVEIDTWKWAQERDTFEKTGTREVP